jgi:Carboxypeptidase regulatory-like domain
MSRAVVCLVATLNLAAAASAVAQSPPPSRPARDTPAAAAGGTAVVRGRVVDAATGRGLSRVQVRANTNTSGPPPVPYPWAATTDGDGRYEIKGIPAGTYTIAATKQNYVRDAYGAERVEGPGKRMTLTDGQVLEKIDFRLTRAGVITGKVVDEFGDPVSDVQVMPMRYQYVQGSRRLMPAGRQGQTNDIGEYRVYGLSPGQYYVSATLRNFNMGGPEPDPDRSGYAPTFFPGSVNVAEAQRLTISPGQTASSINLTLLPIQTARVSGIALDAQGRPLAGAFVNAMLQTLGFAGPSGRPSQTAPDGTFTISGLPPGDYTLRANVMGSQDSAMAAVRVDGSDVTGVQIVAAPPSTIRGRVAFTESATSAAPPRPTAFDIGAVRDWALGQQVRSPAKIKDDGTFEITLQPGRVLIRGAMGPQGNAGAAGASPWRLNRVIVGDIDVGDTGIDVPVNGAIDNVIVEMTNRSNEVSGRVTDAEGKIVRDCFVVVFAQDPAHWTVQTRFLSVARPGLDDLFHARLLAGDYYAIAMSDVESGAWTDPEFLSLAREHATRFSIADGEKKTIDLALSAAPVY